jgi:hypothetical protein
VRSCEICQELVTDKRKALQVLIASADAAIEPPKQKGPLPGLRASQIKPLAVSVLLALALIAVSYFVKPGSALFGEKVQVAESPKKQEPATNAPLTTETTTTNSAIQAAPENKIPSQMPPATNPQAPANAQQAPAIQPSTPQTNTTANTNSTNQKPTQPQKPKPKPKPTANPVPNKPNRVEVFDKDGKKIGEVSTPR